MASFELYPVYPWENIKVITICAGCDHFIPTQAGVLCRAKCKDNDGKTCEKRSSSIPLGNIVIKENKSEAYKEPETQTEAA